MNARSLAVVGLCGALFAAGCDPVYVPDNTLPSPDPQRSLIAPDAWEPVDAEDDLFGDHRPQQVMCPPNAAHVEGDALEIETGLCNYAAFEQPNLWRLNEGDYVTVAFSHQDLAAHDPAEAHVAVGIDGEIMFEWSIPIPSEPRPYAVEFPVDADVEVGAPIQFHLHNHGYNTWKIQAIAASEPHEE